MPDFKKYMYLLIGYVFKTWRSKIEHIVEYAMTIDYVKPYIKFEIDNTYFRDIVYF